MIETREKYTLLIFIYFILFSASFLILVPPFESPDENLHLDYINFISVYKELPNQYKQFNTDKFVGQGHQHPFYYIILGVTNYFFNSDESINYKTIPNKKHIWNKGETGYVPLYNHTQSSFFSTSEDKTFFYLFRSISVLFALVNLFFTFKIAKLFFTDSYFSLLTISIVASLPQFAFISGMINSDNLANMLSTISIYFVLKILYGPEERKNYIKLGVILGFALITKKTLLFFLPGLFLLGSFLYYNQKSDRKLIVRNFTILFSVICFLSMWFFIRNYILYGGIIGSQMEIDTMHDLVFKRNLFAFYFIYPFTPGLFRSFVGVFGWMNLALPRFVYVFYFLLFIFGFVGVLLYLKNKLHRYGGILLSLYLMVLCMCGIVYFNLTFTQFQGRYMFPIVSLMAVIITAGMKYWFSKIKSDKNKKIILSIIFLSFIIIDIVCVLEVTKFYYNIQNYL